ncbi:Cysteine desulfurase [Pirellula sp. SH-Sr6A]|uniref:cysteine desulfurase family protein n=1 Tax=Pirellula sp. SH-Sr6A TaxID=1632865 RepID=UPI00078BE8E3|nr:cysteine desulfurase family protein [Pirellula sp. SH-Sr6A]AMV34079.1 Cysteine desulfurase [Pirellula sp. SH-Sr6A]
MNAIYLDNHATTRVDPRVVQAMLPWFDTHYANPGSSTHEPGRQAKEAIDDALIGIADFFGAQADELIVTSGATESNNLAAFGICLHPRQKRRKIVSVVSEHQAMLGPLQKLQKLGFEVRLLPVQSHQDSVPGQIDLTRIAEEIDADTALVSVMLANNEIGVLQPVREIAAICTQYEVPLHTDATQGVGRIPVDLSELGVDLLSYSAHKVYGPKGIGGLLVRGANARVKLAPQIVGGGQQSNLRSGTLASSSIIGMRMALDIAKQTRASESIDHWKWRDRLWQLLANEIAGLSLNGPGWGSEPCQDENGRLSGEQRLTGNLNVCFPKVDGQSLMLEARGVAVSSGSACTSAHPEPSHVLRAIGRSEDEARASLRFGIGRFNSESEIEQAAEQLIHAYRKLAAFVA